MEKRVLWVVALLVIVLAIVAMFYSDSIKLGPPGNELDIEQISTERYTHNKMDTWSPGSSRIAVLGDRIFGLEIREDSPSGRELLLDLKYRNENEVWKKVPGLKFGPAHSGPVMVADDEMLHVIYPGEIEGQGGCDVGGNVKHYTVSLEGGVEEIDTSGIWPPDYYVCTQRYSIALHSEQNQILLTMYVPGNEIPSGLVLARFDLDSGEWQRGNPVPTDRDNVNFGEGVGYTSIATFGNEIYVSSTVWRSFDIGEYIYHTVALHKSIDNGKNWEKATLCKVDEEYLDGGYNGQGCLNLDIMELDGEINVLYSANPNLGAMSGLGPLNYPGFYLASSADSFRPRLVHSGQEYPYDVGGSLGEFESDLFVVAPQDEVLTFWKTEDFGENWKKVSYTESRDSDGYMKAYNPMTFKDKYSLDSKEGLFGLITDRTRREGDIQYNRLSFFELDLDGISKNEGSEGGIVKGGSGIE